MKVYLASSYSNHPTMAQIAEQLQNSGIEVTSRWIYGYHEFAEGSNEDSASFNAWCATEDLEDIMACDTFIHFNLPGSIGRGGRHIELGFALAQGKEVIIVGGRENVFHYLPCLTHFETITDLISGLTQQQANSPKS